MWVPKDYVTMLNGIVEDLRKENAALSQDIRKLTDALQAANQRPRPFFGGKPEDVGVVGGYKSILRVGEELEKKYAS